jgi:hypothetical protein
MGKPDRKKPPYLGRVTWRALAPQIRAELAEGWSKRTVYDKYAERLRIGYSQFLRYCRKAEPPQPAPAPPPAVAQAAASLQRPPPAPAAPRGEKTGAEPQPAFHFDPLDAYQKKFV